MSEAKHSQQMEFPDVMSANRINYDLPESANVCSHSNLVQTQAHKTSYKSSETLQFRINNSTAFINPKKSYIRLKVRTEAKQNTANGVQSMKWTTGSALNIINSCQFTTQTGTQCWRDESLGDRQALQQRYEHTADYLARVGSVAGYAKAASGDIDSVEHKTGTITAGSVGSVEVVYVIPLWWLGGAFALNQLLPPYLISGGLLEIQFNKPAQIGVWSASAGALSDHAYFVEDAVLMLESCEITDKAMSVVKKAASRDSGLQLAFKAYDLKIVSAASSNKINMDQTKSVGRGYKGMVISKPTADLDNVASDGMVSDTAKLTNLFWKLGSSQWPQQPLNYDDPSKEIFYGSLMSMGKQDPFHNNGSNVEYKDANEYQMIIQDLKPNSGSMSGVPLSLGRVLNYQATFASSAARTHYFYLEYLTVLKVYLNRTRVFS